MISLSNLKNTHRPEKRTQRVGRGSGSNRGKTCGRGHKGDKSRSGYKRRYGNEGGQLALFRKLPIRGFSNARFKQESVAINLREIEVLYQDGEIVNLKTLYEKGYNSLMGPRVLKVLGDGKLTKKVKIEAHGFSKSAKEKLDHLKADYSIIS